MLRGKGVCDGVLSVKRCTSCSLEGQAVPTPAAHLLSPVPLPFARALEQIGLSGGVWTALRMPELIRARHAAVQALLRKVDGIVALKEWVRALLVRNGIPASKIIVSEHGLLDAARPSEPIDVGERPLRVAFFGRADRVKGADTLVKAVRSLPGLDLELHLYGVMQSAGDEKYWTELERLAAYDQRIKFLPAVPDEEVIPLLRRYHLLAGSVALVGDGPIGGSGGICSTDACDRCQPGRCRRMGPRSGKGPACRSRQRPGLGRCSSPVLIGCGRLCGRSTIERSLIWVARGSSA